MTVPFAPDYAKKESIGLIIGYSQFLSVIAIMIGGNLLIKVGNNLDDKLQDIYYILGVLIIISIIPLYCGLRDVITHKDKWKITNKYQEIDDPNKIWE